MHQIQLRLNFDDAANALLVYYWTGDKFHLGLARASLTKALSHGNDPETVRCVVNNTLPLTGE